MNLQQEMQLNMNKLQMLQALTRSQAAIASILEQTALAANEYQLPASLIREQLRLLAGYQSTMISQLSGVRIKQVIRCKPTNGPWLNIKLQGLTK